MNNEQQDLVDTVESIDRVMRSIDDCDRRAITITEKQYYALLARTDGTYDTPSAALFTLLRETNKHRKKENGVLPDDYDVEASI